MNRTDKFVSDFSRMTDAGVGVIFITTRDPHRTIEVLERHAAASQIPSRRWDYVNGWVKPAILAGEEEEREMANDPMQALRRINEEGKKWSSGLFLVTYPHWQLKASPPPMIQLLKEYARSFPTGDQRLAMLVPEGYTPCAELRHDIAMLDFPLPDREELELVIHQVSEDTILFSQAKAIKDAEKAGRPAPVFPAEVEHPFTDEEFAQFASNAAGMTVLETSNAAGEAAAGSGKTPSFAAWNKFIMDAKVSVVKRSEVLTIMPSAPIEDVGGLDLLKTYIGKRVRAFGQDAKDAGVKTPKGFLLAGPPGTGKSLIAKATASILGIPAVLMDIGSVFAGIVGESESRVRGALKTLDSISPVVVLVDEVDKGLGGSHQASGDSGVTKRVLGAILSHMQESQSPIYWIFTANRVTGLPPELIRKGRMDDVFYVALPNILEREQVFMIHLRKARKDPASVDLRALAIASKGYVSAEIEAAVTAGVLTAFSEDRALTTADILQELEEMTPLSAAFPEEMREMEDWANKNAKKTSTPEESAALLACATPEPPRRRIIRRPSSN